MNKATRTDNGPYQPPTIEVGTVAVEQGFLSSTDDFTGEDIG